MRALLMRCAGLLALASVLAGCAPSFAAEQDEEICFDWVPFDSVEQAAESGVLVVRADLEAGDVTVKMWGQEASLHRATITEVFKGDAGVGDVLDVVSTPASCTSGAPYPDGDPMLVDEATLVLDAGQRAWGSADFMRTITPYAGVWDERPAND